MELKDTMSEIDDFSEDDIIDTLKEDRILLINQDIDNQLCEKVCMQIMKWNLDDKYIPVPKRKRITVLINSDGGDAVFGMHIIDAIKYSTTPIVTIGLSVCYSIAGYILASGCERYCYPSTILLLHDGECGYSATATKGKDIQRFYERIDKKLEDFLINNTNITEEFLDKNRTHEYFMFAEEMKELGYIDKIIGVDCSVEEIMG